MSLFMILFLVSLVLTIIFISLGSYFYNDCEERLSNICAVSSILCFTATVILLILVCSLIDVEGDNRELFTKQQQEYIVLSQYIKSNKSDSILESTDMMRRITNYNNIVIEKQNDMTRPIRKYWTVGVDWNELVLINLQEILEKGE